MYKCGHRDFNPLVRISADRDRPFRHRDRRFGIVTDRSGIVTGGALQG
jgi:hypothetical protein